MTIDYEAAQRVIAAVLAEATGRGLAMAVAVTDPAGDPVATARMDGANAVALRLAVDKAYTAVAFGAPSHRWAEATAPGGADWGMANAAGGRILVLAGGLPIQAGGAGGTVIGAVGVSGAAPPVDLACAEAGCAALDDD
ncbi:GlcG/HbpS family heme-binding protein [Plantactinospora sp. WMMC1484]|uniref:GlcG/HbpS family heme-binding protein n=1 Tax=Plantactinospora sp. WMMC1484 TaxID=3404122 RepID=UPI003BF5E484